MASYNLSINGKTYKVEADPKMPLLWVIRDLVGLQGTKYGCGMAQCGACTVHINGNPIDVLSEYVYKDEAIPKAREKAGKLKESLDRQQFRQIIQGVVDNNIVAREEIPPFRKDVLAKMSGGDRTRKDKLLEAQKKGKSRMIQTGKVHLPQQALFSLIEN